MYVDLIQAKRYRVCGLVSCGLSCQKGKPRNLCVYVLKPERLLSAYFYVIFTYKFLFIITFLKKYTLHLN